MSAEKTKPVASRITNGAIKILALIVTITAGFFLFERYLTQEDEMASDDLTPYSDVQLSKFPIQEQQCGEYFVLKNQRLIFAIKPRRKGNPFAYGIYFVPLKLVKFMRDDSAEVPRMHVVRGGAGSKYVEISISTGDFHRATCLIAGNSI